MSAPNTIKIDEVEYVRKDSVLQQATPLDGLPYCIVRSAQAGVFAGYVSKREGDTVLMLNARRIWYWSGAASLSQLAVDGTNKPNECKFPCEVPDILILGVCEILSVTKKAQESIASVKVWAQ